MTVLSDHNMNFYCRSPLKSSNLIMLLSMCYWKKPQMNWFYLIVILQPDLISAFVAS